MWSSHFLEIGKVENNGANAEHITVEGLAEQVALNL